MRQRTLQSGDTLVEVLIATAILSAAVIAGLGIMNYGIATIYTSIERTQVEAAMTTQISLVKYTRDAFVRANRDGTTGAAAVWNTIATTSPTSGNAAVCNGSGAPNTNVGTYKPFYLKEDATQGAAYVAFSPITAATAVPSAGKGLWVETVRTSATSNYIDVYVKACWQPALGNVNEEAKTVVRLYDPQ